MESIYQLPSKSCDSVEHRSFWLKVITDQKASNLGAKRFCEQHQSTSQSIYDYANELNLLLEEIDLTDKNRTFLCGKRTKYSEKLPAQNPFSLLDSTKSLEQPKEEPIQKETIWLR